MKNTAIFLFDYSGVMATPWLDNGYTCYLVDIQHPTAYKEKGVTEESPGLYKVHWDLSIPWMPPVDPQHIAFVASFPPCDHLAVSGASWFKGKGLRRLGKSIEYFATSVEICEWSRAPYLIENPVSTISSYWRKPDHTFDPKDYSGFHKEDNYTKKTCLWTGNGFVMPPVSIHEEMGEIDTNWVLKHGPGEDRKMLRSMTPKGFSKAVFEANRYH